MRPNVPEQAEGMRGRNDGPNGAEDHVATLNRCKDVPDAEEDDMRTCSPEMARRRLTFVVPKIPQSVHAPRDS